MIYIGMDKFAKEGPPTVTKNGAITPIDNCSNYKSFGYNPCRTGFMIGEYFENEDVHIKLVDNLTDTKYIYPVGIRDFGHSIGFGRSSREDVGSSFLDKIPSKPLKDIRENRAKLLVYYGNEEEDKNGDSLFRLYEEFKNKLLEKRIPTENVIYCDANILLKTEFDISDINLIAVNYCTNSVSRYNTQHKQNLYHGKDTDSIENRTLWENSKDKIRSKHFLCYNRLPKSHRAVTVLSLYKNNNLDKGIVSFPDFDMSPYNTVQKKEDYMKHEHYKYLLKDDELISSYENAADSLLKKLPLVLDKDNFMVCHSIINNNISHYLDSYFTICTESHFASRMENGNAIGFTEKTWKPITNFHPFILLANKGSLKYLKEYGFKTFSPFIDESYDDIDDAGERFLAIEKEINKLCNKSVEEIHEWYWSIKDILKHNYYHFYGTFQKDQRRDFLNQLEGQINELA